MSNNLLYLKNKALKQAKIEHKYKKNVFNLSKKPIKDTKTKEMLPNIIKNINNNQKKEDKKQVDLSIMSGQTVLFQDIHYPRYITNSIISKDKSGVIQNAQKDIQNILKKYEDLSKLIYSQFNKKKTIAVIETVNKEVSDVDVTEIKNKCIDLFKSKINNNLNIDHIYKSLQEIVDQVYPKAGSKEDKILQSKIVNHYYNKNIEETNEMKNFDQCMKGILLNLGVCRHKALLVCFLLDSINIKSMPMITKDESHAYNVIKVNNKCYKIDTHFRNKPKQYDFLDDCILDIQKQFARGEI